MRPQTPARENAVKAIYALSVDGRPVGTIELARELGVSAASASTMIGRLAADGLVRRCAARRIVLTGAGERAAQRIVRRHRVLEAFLVQELGLGWDEVHDEAEVLEHAVSDRLLDVLDARIGHPERDPHGDPIPRGADGGGETWGESLSDVPCGVAFRIERVRDRDAEALRYLAQIGAVPGGVVRVERRGPSEDPMWIRVGSSTEVIAAGLAGLVHGRRVLEPIRGGGSR